MANYYESYFQFKAKVESADIPADMKSAIVEGYSAIYEQAIMEGIKDTFSNIMKKLRGDNADEGKKEAKTFMQKIRDVNDGNPGKKKVLATMAAALMMSASLANATPSGSADITANSSSSHAATEIDGADNNNASTGYTGHNPRTAVNKYSNGNGTYFLYDNGTAEYLAKDGSKIFVEPDGNIHMCNADDSGVVGMRADKSGLNQRTGEVVEKGCSTFDNYGGYGNARSQRVAQTYNEDTKEHADQVRHDNNARTNGQHASAKMQHIVDRAHTPENAHFHEFQQITNGGNNTYMVDGKQVGATDYYKTMGDDQDNKAKYSAEKARLAQYNGLNELPTH